MPEPIGIENLTKAFKNLINFGEELEYKAADGKLTFIEVLTTTAQSIPGIWDVVKNGKQIYAEFMDLDDDETDKLVTTIAEELNLENDRVEKQVEAGVEVVFALAAFMQTLKKVEGV